MKEPERTAALIEDALAEVSSIARAVGERGCEDIRLAYDDYRVLLGRREYRTMVTSELYENYFLPERHEFDWAVLERIVTAVTDPRTQEYLRMIAGGVLATATYSLLASAFRHAAASFREARLASERSEPYSQAAADVEALRSFFSSHDSVRIVEVEAGTSIPRERIYPLLKLLGFVHYRSGSRSCSWSAMARGDAGST